MLNFKFDPESKYLEACSYGPDSMSLLDMMLKEGVKPVVCFVNYHKRSISDNEENDLRDYCCKNHLSLEVLDTKSLVHEKSENFQDWARRVRYDFFAEIYKKYDAEAIFIAHQQDDLIETYLLQKQRKAHVSHYGLTEVSTVKDMIVVRPLLNYTKQDLLDYDQENHVPYSIDMSNFEDKYTRNKIRHSVIDKLNEVDRENIIQQMKAENDEKTEFIKGLKEKIDLGEELNIRELISLSKDEFAETLIQFVSRAPIHINLSTARLTEIRKMCLAQQPNISMKLKDGVFLIKEYDNLTLGNNIEELPYSYTLEKPGVLDTEVFHLDFTKGAEDRGIKDEDYPLAIRTALPGDEYIVHNYLCQVRRLYIDWKMPTRLRYVWPIFLNKDGKIIYVPRYRKAFKEYHKSILNVHTKEDEA